MTEFILCPIIRSERSQIHCLDVHSIQLVKLRRGGTGGFFEDFRDEIWPDLSLSDGIYMLQERFEEGTYRKAIFFTVIDGELKPSIHNIESGTPNLTRWPPKD